LPHTSIEYHFYFVVKLVKEYEIKSSFYSTSGINVKHLNRNTRVLCTPDTVSRNGPDWLVQASGFGINFDSADGGENVKE